MNSPVLHRPEIRKVEKDSEEMRLLLDFVTHFSWQEVREHTLHMVRNWMYQDWETPFLALLDGRPVGMVTLMKTDYYPLPDVFPWVSTLFVAEACRGQRISGLLIDCANEYAQTLGFQRTYIPTEHTGLYEKYGYRYLRDIVNYGGGTDRLYVKDLL